MAVLLGFSAGSKQQPFLPNKATTPDLNRQSCFLMPVISPWFLFPVPYLTFLVP